MMSTPCKTKCLFTLFFCSTHICCQITELIDTVVGNTQYLSKTAVEMDEIESDDVARVRKAFEQDKVSFEKQGKHCSG